MTRAEFAGSVGVAVFLVCVGHLLVLQRTLNGPEGFEIRGDTTQYVAMIEQRPASAPFRFRILVPAIARMLPLPPLEALRAISYFSLFVAYLGVLATCRAIGLSPGASLIGLAGAFTAYCQLYAYHNPYLTDASALAALSVGVYALVANRFVFFLGAVVLGTLARETVVIMAPLWFLLRNRRQGLIVALLAVVCVAAPRVLLPFTSHSVADSWQVASRLFEDPLGYVTKAILSWDVLWIGTIAGVACVPMRSRRVIVASFVVMTLGAFATTLVAVDIPRMLAVLLPLVAVGLASLAATMDRRTTALFAAMIALRSIVVFPTHVMPRFLPLWVLIPLFGLQAVFLCVVAVRLRGRMRLAELWGSTPGNFA